MNTSLHRMPEFVNRKNFQNSAIFAPPSPHPAQTDITHPRNSAPARKPPCPYRASPSSSLAGIKATSSASPLPRIAQQMLLPAAFQPAGLAPTAHQPADAAAGGIPAGGSCPYHASASRCCCRRHSSRKALPLPRIAQQMLLPAAFQPKSLAPTAHQPADAAAGGIPAGGPCPYRASASDSLAGIKATS